jgi:hypothetical protein
MIDNQSQNTFLQPVPTPIEQNEAPFRSAILTHGKKNNTITR